MTYGQKLRIIRAMMGLSQREVSVLAKIPRPVISLLEQDRITPSETYRRRIETALDWPQFAEQAFALLDS